MFRGVGAATGAAVATVALFVTAAPAAANPSRTLPIPGGSSLPSNSVSNQYVEVLPNGGTSARSSAQPLPDSVRRLIENEGGADASLLLAIATSPNYGAPPSLGPGAGSAASESAVGAVAGATGDERNVILLLVGMFAVTGWLLAASAFGHRARESRPPRLPAGADPDRR